MTENATLDDLREAQDRADELENQLAIERRDHEHTRYQLREMERERDDLDYRLRDVERERDGLRSQVSDLESQIYSARRDAESLRWR